MAGAMGCARRGSLQGNGRFATISARRRPIWGGGIGSAILIAYRLEEEVFIVWYLSVGS